MHMVSNKTLARFSQTYTVVKQMGVDARTPSVRTLLVVVNIPVITIRGTRANHWRRTSGATATAALARLGLNAQELALG